MNKYVACAVLSCLGVASASSTSVNLRVPVSVTVPNPCAPADVVSLSGNVHLVGKVDTDPSGTQIKVHVNLQDFGGTTPAGRSYRAQLNGKADIDLASTVLPATARGNVYARLVSQGPTDNFKFRLSFDIAVDANGNVSVLNPSALPDGSCNG